MPHSDRLAARLLETSLKFLRRGPWDDLPADAFFLMRVPTELHCLAAVITGSDRIALGLDLFRGPDALLRTLRQVFSATPVGSLDDKPFDQLDLLNLSLEPLGDIPPGFRQFLERAGFGGRSETPAPMVLVNRPGQEPRAPTRQDLRTLLFCLTGIMQAMDGGELSPARVAHGQPLLQLEMSGPLPLGRGDRLDWHISRVAWDVALGGEDLLTDLILPGDERPGGDAPAPGDSTDDSAALREWQRNERLFRQGLLAPLRGPGGSPSSRALKRFFGDLEVGRQVLSDDSQLAVRMAFAEWLAADYRPTWRSDTWLEKQLSGQSLSGAAGALGRARQQAILSIYQVQDLEANATLALEDITCGQRLVVHDAALSASAQAGWFLPLRLIRLESWWIPLLAGPPLSEDVIEEALVILEQDGWASDHENRCDRARLFGRLWLWWLWLQDQQDGTNPWASGKHLGWSEDLSPVALPAPAAWTEREQPAFCSGFRALIHVTGPPGAGKTRLIEALLERGRHLISVARCEQDEALSSMCESVPPQHQELIRYLQAGASGVALLRFPPSALDDDELFCTDLMQDASQAVLLEGDCPFGAVDLRVYLARPLESGARLLQRVSRPTSVLPELEHLLAGSPDSQHVIQLLGHLLGQPLDKLAEWQRPALREQVQERLPVSVGRAVSGQPSGESNEMWAVAPGYEGIERAQVVVVNVTGGARREGARRLLDELIELRRDKQVAADVLGWRGNRLPITAVLADLADPRDPGRKKVLARIRREVRKVNRG